MRLAFVSCTKPSRFSVTVSNIEVIVVIVELKVHQNMVQVVFDRKAACVSVIYTFSLHTSERLYY